MAQFARRNKRSLRRLVDDAQHPRLTVHSGWKTERLLTDASQYFALMLHDINQARQSIDFNFYIVHLDSLGSKIIDALIKASQRGVRVRLLMDGVGSSLHAGSIAQRMTHAGCEVQIFRPLPFSPKLYRWSGLQGSGMQQLMHFLMNINQRNHYKLGIIDSRIIWSGSFNISEDHLALELGGKGWRDYGVRLTDDNTDDIQLCFDMLWSNAARRPTLSRINRFRTNLSVPMRMFYNKLMLFRIRFAKKRIWISNAYFAPSRSVVRALIKARKNNVDVRLILPSISDVVLFPTISRSYYGKLLKNGIRIYKYSDRILHAKVMLIDEHCWIGSTNLNHRSFYHDLELDIALEKPETIKAVKQQLRIDMRQSQKLHYNEFSPYSWTMLKAHFLRIFRYWL